MLKLTWRSPFVQYLRAALKMSHRSLLGLLVSQQLSQCTDRLQDLGLCPLAVG